MSESVLGGRYRVEARIGSGGMAEVYRGVDTVLDRTVAIKILLPQFARDASFVEKDKDGNLVNRTEAIAQLGGSAHDNEECYLISKMNRGLGLVYTETQARI